jgi:hypothetical protein
LFAAIRKKWDFIRVPHVAPASIYDCRDEHQDADEYARFPSLDFLHGLRLPGGKCTNTGRFGKQKCLGCGLQARALEWNVV